jgi:hypothetical protein
MKGKIFLIGIFTVLLVISISQIFTIPPYHRDIFPVYKSGYFTELEKNSMIINHAFFTLMTKENRALPWIYLKDINQKTGIVSKLYDRSGRFIISSGEKKLKPNHKIRAFISGNNPNKGKIVDGRYTYLSQIKAEKQCLICHRNRKKGDIMGASLSSHHINGFVYYSSERIILFVIISIITASALFFIYRWDPDKNIKELFDK